MRSATTAGSSARSRSSQVRTPRSSNPEFRSVATSWTGSARQKHARSPLHQLSERRVERFAQETGHEDDEVGAPGHSELGGGGRISGRLDGCDSRATGQLGSQVLPAERVVRDEQGAHHRQSLRESRSVVRTIPPALPFRQLREDRTRSLSADCRPARSDPRQHRVADVGHSSSLAWSFRVGFLVGTTGRSSLSRARTRGQLVARLARVAKVSARPRRPSPPAQDRSRGKVREARARPRALFPLTGRRRLPAMMLLS